MMGSHQPCFTTRQKDQSKYPGDSLSSWTFAWNTQKDRKLTSSHAIFPRHAHSSVRVLWSTAVHLGLETGQWLSGLHRKHVGVSRMSFR